MYVIQGSLIGSKYVEVMHYTSRKENWDKLKNVYERDEKVKGAKPQTYRRKLEHLTMKEDEYIASCFLQVDEIVNNIWGLGEKVQNPTLIQKILRSIPMRFDSKVSIS